jgi:hypothetical protein
MTKINQNSGHDFGILQAQLFGENYTACPRVSLTPADTNNKIFKL